jgi:hypothetical protein
MRFKKGMLLACLITTSHAAYDDFFGNQWSATFITTTHVVSRTPEMITWTEPGIVYRGKHHICIQNVNLNHNMDLFQFAEILGENIEIIEITPPEAKELVRLFLEQQNQQTEELNSPEERPMICSPLNSEGSYDTDCTTDDEEGYLI